MPEKDFYLCDADLEMLATYIFANDARIVPDVDYSTPQYRELRSWSELEPIIKTSRNVRLFVLSQSWERAPLEIHSSDRNGAVYYFISKKNGGPAIDIAASRPLAPDGTPLIGQGSLAYYPRFWNPKTQEMEVPPDQLKTFYKSLVKLVARKGESVRFGSRTYILTANARATGRKLAHIDVKL